MRSSIQVVLIIIISRREKKKKKCTKDSRRICVSSLPVPCSSPGIRSLPPPSVLMVVKW